MQTKPWQIAIIVIGLLVGGGLTFYNLFFAGEVRLASSLTLIDVNTGEVFRVSIADKGYVMPGRHPVTRKRTLLSINQNKDGSWEVPPHLLSDLDAVEVEVKVVDKETGRVTVPVGTPKTMTHPSKWTNP